VKVRDVIKLVERDGWRIVHQAGSHRQYKHPVKKGRVTIAGHPSEDMDKGTYGNILKQAGVK
jgi:predicted RNA binding protein YcfA (HicA-like mRNA interferase family)